MKPAVKKAPVKSKAVKESKKPVIKSLTLSDKPGFVERIVIREMAKKTITLDEAAKILCEGKFGGWDVKVGGKVYIAYGLGAGTYGTLGTIHGDSGYCTVKSNAGEFWHTNVIQLLPSEQ